MKVNSTFQTDEAPHDDGQHRENQRNFQLLKTDRRANELELSCMGSQFDE